MCVHGPKVTRPRCAEHLGGEDGVDVEEEDGRAEHAAAEREDVGEPRREAVGDRSVPAVAAGENVTLLHPPSNFSRRGNRDEEGASVK